MQTVLVLTKDGGNFFLPELEKLIPLEWLIFRIVI